jgi:hypothetical protein
MTVLGQHTAAELRDWLAAIDYQIDQVRHAYDQFAAMWHVRDAGAESDWKQEWHALLDRYGVARSSAQIALGLAKLDVAVPDSLIPVETEWQAVHHALAPTPGTVSKGDFQDLYGRLVEARGKPVDMSKVPQPKALDADLATYKAADQVIRTAEEVARGAAHAATVGPGTKLLLGAGFLAAVYLTTKAVFR